MLSEAKSASGGSNSLPHHQAPKIAIDNCLDELSDEQIKILSTIETPIKLIYAEKSKSSEQSYAEPIYISPGRWLMPELK